MLLDAMKPHSLLAAALVLGALPTFAGTELTFSDPIGFLSSTGTDQLDLPLGDPVEILVHDPALAGDIVLLAVGGVPAPPGGLFGLDLTTAIFPVNGFVSGAQLDPAGDFTWSTTTPMGLPTGVALFAQAILFDPLTLALATSNTVTLDLKPVAPVNMPLLPVGKHVTVIYSGGNPTSQATMDAAWNECIAAGVDTYELSMAWTDIEVAPGVYDTTTLDSLLSILSLGNFSTYLSITTIDTVNLNLPADLVDPANPQELAPGLTWDAPLMLSRFRTVLDLVVPRLAQNNGFFLVVGNEVDGWLAPRPAQLLPFATFVDAARQHAHGIEPRLAVGVAAQFDAVQSHPTILGALLAVTDNVPLTYYPLKSDFSVQDPSVVPGDFAAMEAAVAPRPLLIQEFGYPSGYAPVPTNGSSNEKQRQFIANSFTYFQSNPKLRFASCLQLGDWDPAYVTLLLSYYGVPDPVFAEYLGTLGLRDWVTGAAKPAYAEFLSGLLAL
jgi:hypothetical protein